MGGHGKCPKDCDVKVDTHKHMLNANVGSCDAVRLQNNMPFFGDAALTLFNQATSPLFSSPSRSRVASISVSVKVLMAS